jgi:hyperosmotically inducible protein
MTGIVQLDLLRGHLHDGATQSVDRVMHCWDHAQLFSFSTAESKEPTGGSMNRNGVSRNFSATLIAVIVSCATCASAQTVAGTPTVATGAAHMTTVSTSPPGSRSADAIILDVRRAIRRVPDMVDSEIRIRAHRGVVTLTGTVPETWQISRAANAARSVRGVTGVSNRLTVRTKHVAVIEQRVASSVG